MAVRCLGEINVYNYLKLATPAGRDVELRSRYYAEACFKRPACGAVCYVQMRVMPLSAKQFAFVERHKMVRWVAGSGPDAWFFFGEPTPEWALKEAGYAAKRKAREAREAAEPRRPRDFITFGQKKRRPAAAQP